MTIIFQSLQAFLIPVMVVFGIIGWRRGFYREVGNAAGIAIALALTTGIGGQFLIGFINRVITLGPRIIALLLGRAAPDTAINPPIPGEPSDGRNLLFRLIFFVVFVVLTYTLTFPWERDPDPKKQGFRKPINFFEKVLGAVFGAIIGFLYFAAFQTFGNEIAANQNRPPILADGTSISIPAPIGVETILGFLPTIAVLAVVILVVLILFRLPRIWR